MPFVSGSVVAEKARESCSLDMAEKKKSIERKLLKLGSMLRSAHSRQEFANLEKYVKAATDASRRQYIRDMYKLRDELLAQGNTIPDELASLPPIPEEAEERRPEA